MHELSNRRRKWGRPSVRLIRVGFFDKIKDLTQHATAKCVGSHRVNPVQRIDTADCRFHETPVLAYTLIPRSNDLINLKSVRITRSQIRLIQTDRGHRRTALRVDVDK